MRWNNIPSVRSGNSGKKPLSLAASEKKGNVLFGLKWQLNGRLLLSGGLCQGALEAGLMLPFLLFMTSTTSASARMRPMLGIKREQLITSPFARTLSTSMRIPVLLRFVDVQKKDSCRK
jgi:hypothetical protein